MTSAKKEFLTLCTEMLADLNREIDARTEELDDDIRALLAQKNAITQCVFREMAHLLDLAVERAEAHDNLIDHCEQWRDQFLIPLRDQSDGKPMAQSIYLTDLINMIAELERVIHEHREIPS